jgi:hypothetical protein
MNFLDKIKCWLWGEDVSIKDIERVIKERETTGDFCPRASKLFKMFMRLHKIGGHDKNTRCIDCRAMQQMLEMELRK